MKTPARSLLAGEMSDTSISKQFSLWHRWVGIIAAAIATTLAYVGWQHSGASQAGIFFGSGAASLVALLSLARILMRRGPSSSHTLSLTKLAYKNTIRNPTRSTLTIGLVAAASFLIIAVSAFRLDPDNRGTGGYALMATSDQPIHLDLKSDDDRWELGFTDEESARLAGWQIDAFRLNRR